MNKNNTRTLGLIQQTRGKSIDHNLESSIQAIRKATENAKNKMIRVHLKEERTLHHDIVGKFGAGKVILRTTKPGTGIIAGGPMRAIFESLGIKDIVAKSNGSSSPLNMIKATFDAFEKSESPKSIASKRSKKITEIITSKNKK